MCRLFQWSYRGRLSYLKQRQAKLLLAERFNETDRLCEADIKRKVVNFSIDLP